MAKRKFELSKKEETELQWAYRHSEKGATRIRYQAVRLYGQGYPVKEIEAITGCSRPSLMEWCRAYRQEGVSGLVDKRRGGNRAKLKGPELEALQELLHIYTPQERLGQATYTKDGQFWTVPDLARIIQKQFGVTYKSATSYRELLHKCGLTRQRPGKQFKSRSTWKVIEFEAEFEKKSSISPRRPPKP